MERNGQQPGLSALIYTRVSRTSETSIDSQEQECRAEADRRGWHVVDVLVDNDRSASRYARKDRASYRKLLKLLPTVDILITWDSSRAQRDLEAYNQLATLCREHGVRWCYRGNVHDLDDADDSFMTGLDALLDVRESDKIRERVNRGLRSQRAAGRPPGRTKFGYRRIYRPDTGTLDQQVEDPETGPLVRELARRVIRGEPVYQIVKDFNDRGIDTPGGGKRWHATTIRALLLSPTYAGKREHHGEIIGDGNWPAILTEEQYFQIKAKFTPGRGKQPRDSRAKSLLSGLATCGVCGDTMARRVPSKKSRHVSYACRNQGCVSRQEQWLDTLVTEAVLRRLERFDLSGSAGAADELRLQLADLRGQLESFYREAEAGRLSAAALVRMEGSYLPRIETLEQQIAEASSPIQHKELTGAVARQRWPGLPLQDKRSVVRALVSVEVLPAGKGRRVDSTTVRLRWNS